MGIEKPNLNFRIRERLKTISARINTTKSIGSMLELCFADFAITLYFQKKRGLSIYLFGSILPIGFFIDLRWSLGTGV